MRHTFAKHGNFYKVSGDTAYGWAFVSTINDVPYFDTGDGKYSDHIPESSIDEVAAHFMEKSRAGLDMHQGDRVADVVFSYPMTDAIMKGVEVSSAKTGLLIGWKPYDKEILAKVASGERIGFSIGGIVESWDIVDAQGNVIESVAAKSAFRTVDVTKSVGYDGSGGMQRRVFRSWKLKEVSLVDRPMQEPALVGVVKGKGSKTVQVAVSTPTEPVRKVRTLAIAFEKQALLTSETDGHQHLVDMDDFDDDGDTRTSYEMKPGDQWGHDHAVVRNADGSLSVAANDGHSHTVSIPSLADGAAPGVTVAMRADEKVVDAAAAAESLTAKIAPSSVPLMANENDKSTETIIALTKRAERAEKMAELNDAHRAYAKSLPDGERDSFVAKSLVDREAIVKASVAYTAQDGTVYYTHDDQRLVKSAKETDALKAENVTEKALRMDAEFSKTATELMSAYPEDAAVHTAIVKAVSLGIKDEAVRKKALDVLKAGGVAFGKLARPNGTTGAVDKRGQDLGGGETVAKAQTDLKTAVEAYQKAHNLKTYEEAFAEATGSDPAARAAYEKVAELRKQAN